MKAAGAGYAPSGRGPRRRSDRCRLEGARRSGSFSDMAQMLSFRSQVPSAAPRTRNRPPGTCPGTAGAACCPSRKTKSGGANQRCWSGTIAGFQPGILAAKDGTYSIDFADFYFGIPAIIPSFSLELTGLAPTPLAAAILAKGHATFCPACQHSGEMVVVCSGADNADRKVISG